MFEHYKPRNKYHFSDTTYTVGGIWKVLQLPNRKYDCRDIDLDTRHRKSSQTKFHLTADRRKLTNYCEKLIQISIDESTGELFQGRIPRFLNMVIHDDFDTE